MATNPMQRKTRNAFLLGMIISLLIAVVVGVVLYMQIDRLQKELAQYKGAAKKSVYVLNQDVKSGQALDISMFTMQSLPTNVVPENATSDVATTLNSYTLSTTDGRTINVEYNNETFNWHYFIRITNNDNTVRDCTIYVLGANNQLEEATLLTAGQRAMYYAGENNTGATYITVSENVAVAKVALKANTIITTSLISRGDEITTNDLRTQEYNVISLPVDLIPNEYIDVRLMLPNGEDYIVLSKKKVAIPMSNGAYLDDTIKMNLTESEILLMSSAIIDNFQIEGSRLYATKYVEAGLQAVPTTTYAPSSEVASLIQNDPNAVNKAISGLRNRINNAISKFGEEDNIIDKMDESTAATQEARKNYLQSLSGATGY